MICVVCVYPTFDASIRHCFIQSWADIGHDSLKDALAALCLVLRKAVKSLSTDDKTDTDEEICQPIVNNQQMHFATEEIYGDDIFLEEGEEREMTNFFTQPNDKSPYNIRLEV
jgi:hypothetical protein